MFHNHRRPHEFLFSLFTLGFGLWVALPTTSMATIAYEQIIRQASELQWGALFMLAGFGHGVSVLVNGSRWWTPITRAVASLILAGSYGTIAIGFWTAGPTSTAVYTFSALTGGSVLAFVAAAYDSGVVWAKWRGTHA